VTRLGQGLRQIFHLFVLFDKDGEDFSLDGYKAVYGFKILKKKKKKKLWGQKGWIP
jgi:hypothetical protein